MTAGGTKLKVVVNTFLAGKIEFGKKLKKKFGQEIFFEGKTLEG